MRALHYIFLSIIILGVVLVLYLSWIPDPSLNLPQFIPGALRRWTNDQPNENLRTAVPFAFMGAAFSLLELRKPFRLRRYALMLLLFGLLVTLAEAGQLFIPHRSADAMDIAWGVVGSLLGMMIPLPLRLIFSRRRDGPEGLR